MVLAREISLIQHDRHLCAKTFKLLPPNGQIILFGKVPLTLLLLLNARCPNQALAGTFTSKGEPARFRLHALPMFLFALKLHSLTTTCYLFL